MLASTDRGCGKKREPRATTPERHSSQVSTRPGSQLRESAHNASNQPRRQRRVHLCPKLAQEPIVKGGRETSQRRAGVSHGAHGVHQRGRGIFQERSQRARDDIGAHDVGPPGEGPGAYKNKEQLQLRPRRLPHFDAFGRERGAKGPCTHVWAQALSVGDLLLERAVERNPQSVLQLVFQTGEVEAAEVELDPGDPVDSVRVAQRTAHLIQHRHDTGSVEPAHPVKKGGLVPI